MTVSNEVRRIILSEFSNLEDYSSLRDELKHLLKISMDGVINFDGKEMTSGEAKALLKEYDAVIRIFRAAICDAVYTAHDKDQARIQKALYDTLVYGKRAYETDMTSATIAKYRRLAIESAAKRMKEKGLL